MGVVQSGDLLGLGLTADSALVGADTGLALGGGGGHGAVVPLVAQSSHFVSLVAVAAGAGVGGEALIGAGRRSYDLVVAVGVGVLHRNATGRYRGIQRNRVNIGQSADVNRNGSCPVRSVISHNESSAQQYAVTRNISGRGKGHKALCLIHRTASQQAGRDTLQRQHRAVIDKLYLCCGKTGVAGNGHINGYFLAGFGIDTVHINGSSCRKGSRYQHAGHQGEDNQKT